jgi:uncharacterized protein YlxP (DUF503 family)
MPNEWLFLLTLFTKLESLNYKRTVEVRICNKLANQFSFSGSN